MAAIVKISALPKMAAAVVCVLFTLSLVPTCSVAIVHAAPFPLHGDTEDKSLIGLLMQYVEQFAKLGKEHPTLMALRSSIDEKLKAGERCDHDEVVAKLKELRAQYRTARAELSESHPKLVHLLATIATLAELLAHEPEYLVTNVDAVMQAKDNMVPGVLYVPSGFVTGYVHRIKADVTEITIPKGSDDGLKVGMHLHLYVRQGALERWRPDGKSYIMGQVASVESNQAQVKLLADIPKTESPISIYFTQPSFTVGNFILAIRFDEVVWQNRPLMNAFLGELRIACTGSDLAMPKILVTDTMRTECVIDVLPIGPAGHSEDQHRTLKEVEKFLAEQPFISNVELNSAATRPKPQSPAVEKQQPFKPDRNSLKTLNEADSWDIGHMADLKKALQNWQNSKLKGAPSDAVPYLLSQLRIKSEEAEKASVAKANEVRSALAAKPSKTPEEIEKLKGELRTAVDEAFDARRNLHLMEVTSLTLKIQTMVGNLSERLDSRSEIVDRRVDDLLNPNYRWDGASLTLKSSEAKLGNQLESLGKQPGVTTQFIADLRTIGWQLQNTGDGELELIVQIPLDAVNTLAKNRAIENATKEAMVLLPNELKGRFARVVVRFGSQVLPREPAIEGLKLLPLRPDVSHGNPSDFDFAGWEKAVDGQLQIIVSISPDKQRAMMHETTAFPNGLEAVATLPSSVMLRASSVVVRIADSDSKVPRSPTLEEIGDLLPIKVETATNSLGSVEGLVTMHGKPIIGTVWFNFPGSLPMAAEIDETGKFKIDSLKPGKYRLTIDSDSWKAARKIPGKYQTEETTPIEIEVMTGKNTFDVELSNPFR